ncbi:MAG: MarR family transcriptional regulator [Corynebacterium sp.]|nr:MarR family transcriptional regulator [Corynebacterium sp.]
MTSPRWLNEEEQQFWRLFLSMDHAFHRSIDEVLQTKHDISDAEFGVLVNLSEAEPNTIRLRDICTRLAWDRSRASHQVTRMVKRGLITKSACPGDGRGVLLNITYEGQRRVEAAAPDHVENVRSLIFDGISPEDRKVIAKLAKHILKVTDGFVIPGGEDVSEDEAEN